MQTRPTFINLFKINLPITAIVSITHRLAGMYNFFITLPLSLYLVANSTKDKSSFDFLARRISDDIFFGLLIIISFNILLYHILTGVRHLIMDLHIGENLQAARLSSFVVMLTSLIIFLFSIGVYLK